MKLNMSMISSFSCRWPESVVPVQYLSETGLTSIPDRYIKAPDDRPSAADHISNNVNNIPVIDLNGAETLELMSRACQEWGFFQLVNHGVSPELMRRARAVWRGFFELQPLEAKLVYANDPKTYVGYGSRVGLDKDAVLDWSDYFFLHFSPVELRQEDTKWPAHPPSCREVTKEYGEQMMKLCAKILKAMSISLGLNEEYMQTAFGGPSPDACMRVGFYPKCPQPELTLGLSSHSDPGGLTLLLPDHDVAGLQVRHSGGSWVTVEPIKDALVVNIGDQIEVMSNGIYKSVEHRVMANSRKDRLSVAWFYNPRSDLVIEPAEELVAPDRPQAYRPMTFAQYRLYIRAKGPRGKAQLHSFRSSTDLHT